MRRFIPYGCLVLGLAAAGCGGSGENPPQSPASGRPTGTTASNDPRAAIFVEKGCPQCHAISSLGVTSATEVGPDLSAAATDVRSRFGVALDEFLKNPTGTMMVVLSAQIQLTETERDSIIHLLEELAEETDEHHDNHSTR